MKINLILVLIMLFISLFTGCAADIDNDREIIVKSGEDTKEEIDILDYSSGIYHDKNWDSDIGTYTGDVIPDEKCAIEIATVIFDAMTKSDEFDNHVVQTVFYDEEDEIWIVSFMRNDWLNSDVITLGGDCSIALRKEDGQVLRIWFGE